MKQSRRQIKRQQSQQVRWYDSALSELTRMDPDFAFERECCGERIIRERYSILDLNQRVGYIRMEQLRNMLPASSLVNMPGAAIGLQQACNLSLSELASNMKPGSILSVDEYAVNYPYLTPITP